MVSSSFADVLASIPPYVRVGIVGSRDYPVLGLVRSFIAGLPVGSVVVSGGNGVVDKTAASMGRRLGLIVDEFKADWLRFGRSAGPIRNREIIRSGLHCLVVFLSSDVPSDGSRDVMKAAKAAGVPVFVFDPKGNPVVLKEKKQLVLF